MQIVDIGDRTRISTNLLEIHQKGGKGKNAQKVTNFVSRVERIEYICIHPTARHKQVKFRAPKIRRKFLKASIKIKQALSKAENTTDVSHQPKMKHIPK